VSKVRTAHGTDIAQTKIKQMRATIKKAWRERRSPLVWLVTLVTLGSGLLNIYSVINNSLPERTSLLLEFVPFDFLQLSRTLTLVIGFALVVSSINIFKRKRRAFHVVASLAALSIIFHLTKGVDYEEASLSLVLLGVLYLARREFTVRSGLPDFRLAAVRATVAFVLLFLYGVGGFWLLEAVEFNFKFHVADAVRATLAIVTLAGDPDLTPQTAYALWFARSIYLLTFVAVAYAGFALFLPVVYRFRTLPRERARAAALLERYGRSSIDYFKLWSDKAYYFSATGNCFIAYAVGGNTAVALGDPVGSEEEVETTIQGFAKLCRGNDWHIAFHQTLPDFIAVYQKLGLRKLKIGDEASIDLTTFNLEGKERRKLRAVVNRFEREGIRLEQFTPPIRDDVLRQAREVSDDWLRLPGKRERTFSLGLFDENYVRQTPVVAIFSSDGKMLAFVNRIPAYAPGEATIDLMRHRTDAPNGTMDFLFTKLFLICREEGYKQFSLGLAPLAGFTDHERRTAEERAMRFFLDHLNFVFNYAGLRRYKAKFAPSWEPRYLIYRHAHELPRIAYALTRVGELHQGKRRGASEWQPCN